MKVLRLLVPMAFFALILAYPAVKAAAETPKPKTYWLGKAMNEGPQFKLERLSAKDLNDFAAELDSAIAGVSKDLKHNEDNLRRIFSDAQKTDAKIQPAAIAAYFRNKSYDEPYLAALEGERRDVEAELARRPVEAQPPGGPLVRAEQSESEHKKQASCLFAPAHLQEQPIFITLPEAGRQQSPPPLFRPQTLQEAIDQAGSTPDMPILKRQRSKGPEKPKSPAPDDGPQ